MQPLSLFICREEESEEEFTAEELAPSRTRPGSLDRGTLPQQWRAHTRPPRMFRKTIRVRSDTYTNFRKYKEP